MPLHFYYFNQKEDAKDIYLSVPAAPSPLPVHKHLYENNRISGIQTEQKATHGQMKDDMFAPAHKLTACPSASML